MAGKSDRVLLEELHAMFGASLEKITKHDTTLYGNGRMGLVTKVTIMWLGLTTCVGVATTVVCGLLWKHFSG